MPWPMGSGSATWAVAGLGEGGTRSQWEPIDRV